MILLVIMYEKIPTVWFFLFLFYYNYYVLSYYSTKKKNYALFLFKINFLFQIKKDVLCNLRLYYNSK